MLDSILLLNHHSTSLSRQVSGLGFKKPKTFQSKIAEGPRTKEEGVYSTRFLNNDVIKLRMGVEKSSRAGMEERSESSRLIHMSNPAPISVR